MKKQARQLLPSIMGLGQTCQLREMCANVSDEEIAESSKSNKECFKCLVERYDRKMKTYVRRITGTSEESAQDIVQEVFLKVYANIDKFDRNMKFSSWLYRIAHNEAVNNYIYEKKRRTQSITWDENGEPKEIIKDTCDIWKEIQQESINMQLGIALAKIPEKYQEVITLNYFEEKSYHEISSELTKPVNTIGTMLSRGKKMLKRELLDMGIPCEDALMYMDRDFSFKV